MNSHIVAQVAYRVNNDITFRFISGFDEGAVQLIKAFVRADERSYDPGARVWAIAARHVDALLERLQRRPGLVLRIVNPHVPGRGGEPVTLPHRQARPRGKGLA